MGKTNILLTGATGFLGYRILERLVQIDSIESITAAGRSLNPIRTVKHPKVHYQLGNLEEEEYAINLVRNSDIIINAASLSSPWGKETDFIKANVLTQRNLIKASIELKIERFIYISTLSVCFNSKNRFLVKESDFLPSEFINTYSKTKRDAEIMLENSKIPYIILRPWALIGRGDRVIMPRLIRAFDEGKLRIIGNGKNIADLTSVENIVEAVILSIQTDEYGLYQTYNISNGEPVVLWKCIEYMLASLGKELPKNRIPYSVAIAIAHLMELKSKFTSNKEPTLTKYGVRTLAKSFTIDISKARKLLGYEPKVTIRKSIDEFVKWYLNEGRSKTVPE
jgi:nucleoside-diphosphate-sugar epimerase